MREVDHVSIMCAKSIVCARSIMCAKSIVDNVDSLGVVESARKLSNPKRADRETGESRSLGAGSLRRQSSLRYP